MSMERMTDEEWRRLRSVRRISAEDFIEATDEGDRARASEAELAEALEGIVVHEEAYHRGDAEVATQARAALAKVSP